MGGDITYTGVKEAGEMQHNMKVDVCTQLYMYIF